MAQEKDFCAPSAQSHELILLQGTPSNYEYHLHVGNMPTVRDLYNLFRIPAVHGNEVLRYLSIPELCIYGKL